MKKTTIFLAVMLAVSVLAGCNSGAKDSETKAPVKTEKEATEALETEAQEKGPVEAATEIIGNVPAAEKDSPQTEEVQENTELITEKMEITEAGVPEADWNGTYEKEDESITIEAVDATSFEFQFSNSGIAGVARVGENPNSAAFEGDDFHTVQFVLSGSQLDVTVLTQDSEAGNSPINGVYQLKQ